MGTLLSIGLKYVLPVLAVAGLLFGVYEYGHSKGYDSGYQTAWNKQQATIQGMVDKQNAQTLAQNQKIDDLVKKSQQDTLDLAAANMRAAVTRETVVTQYVHDNPTIAASCGWDIPTVNTINQLIDADPANAANNQTAAATPVTAASTPGASQ